MPCLAIVSGMGDMLFGLRSIVNGECEGSEAFKESMKRVLRLGMKRFSFGM